jgi:multidrug efflux pump subunit AcrA (membrane-fusion protein)
MNIMLESTSYQHIYKINTKANVSRIIGLVLLLGILFPFLPWTQNIRTTGSVTTLRQEQRAQHVNTIIPGRIVKWYIKEGDLVNAGDTLVQLTEIKDDYLDPMLIDRTNEQLVAKSATIDYYEGKTLAQQNQLNAIQSGLNIKIDQLQNKLRQLNFKIQSDSASVVAVKNEFSIAQKQYTRQTELYNQGLVSLTQLEQRNQSFQTAQAKVISAENNLANSRQERSIVQLELLATQQDYTEKMSKIQGEIMQARSQIAGGQSDVAKLRNQVSNYQNRSKLYFVVAPQSGQVVQAKRSGIGEVIKEGEVIAEIVPQKVDYAVEIFVKPLDVPLLNVNQKIRFIFDGFPAIVFSGWPQASYGTFGGEVVAIENTIAENGKYRVLVREDKSDKAWPKELRLGTGTQAIALLKEVPIWYELWRNINGFPPDFYKIEDKTKDKNKK